MIYIKFQKDFGFYRAGDGAAFADNNQADVYLRSSKDGTSIAVIDHERMKRDKVDPHDSKSA